MQKLFYINKMSVLSLLISGTVMMIGYFIKDYFSSAIYSSIAQYLIGPASFFVTQYVESIYKNYKYNKSAQNILFKYLKDLDLQIKENVLDIDDIEQLKKFLDYNFISAQTNFELNSIEENIYLNKSMIEEVYEDLEKYLKITKFTGLVIGDIGAGKTTLRNELLDLPDFKKGLTETRTGESVTVGDPIGFNNPDYYPWLILYDSQGFDKDTNFYDNIESMKNYIENKFKCNGNEFVNFIIYCIQGERFTKTEKENLIKLHNLYPANKLPIIVVNTRGLNANADKLLAKIEYDLKNNYGIKDIIYISVSAIKSGFSGQVFPTKNLDKLRKIISSLTETSLKSTIYKLFFEKVKQVHEKNMNYSIDKVDIKNENTFDVNYQLIMKNCLGLKISEATANTMKTHYFKTLEKSEIKENANYNANKLRIEFEDQINKIVDNDVIDKYIKAYEARVSEHIKNGTTILMKKLMNEDFIFNDILKNLQKSHKIELYINKLIKHFKNVNKF